MPSPEVGQNKLNLLLQARFTLYAYHVRQAYCLRLPSVGTHLHFALQKHFSVPDMQVFSD